MYSWIWRHLPGGLAGKMAGSAVLVLAAVTLLFLVVFPWAEPRLPFNNVTVEPTTPGPQPTSSPGAPTPGS